MNQHSPHDLDYHPPARKITVKCYGIVPMTKPTYFTIQTIVLIFTALLILALWIFRNQIPQFPLYFSILFIAGIAEIVEASLMAWRFHVAENKARQNATRSNSP